MSKLSTNNNNNNNLMILPYGFFFRPSFLTEVKLRELYPRCFLWASGFDPEGGYSVTRCSKTVTNVACDGFYFRFFTKTPHCFSQPNGRKSPLLLPACAFIENLQLCSDNSDIKPRESLDSDCSLIPLLVQPIHKRKKQRFEPPLSPGDQSRFYRRDLINKFPYSSFL